MLVFGLERIPHFYAAIFQLIQLGETANLQCTKSKFSLVVSHSSHPLVAALRIKPPYFFYYIISDPKIFSWRIPLNPLLKNLSDGIACPAMVFTVYNENPPRSLQTFRDSSIGTFGRKVFSREMTLSHEEDQEADLGNIDFATFVAIDSEEFRRVARELISIHKVLVTLTNLQVKFSNPLKEVILTKEKGECIIGGVEIGEEIEFKITLKPEMFFIRLILWSKRVWLYKTTKARGAMYANIDLNARFEIYFPHL